MLHKLFALIEHPRRRRFIWVALTLAGSLLLITDSLAAELKCQEAFAKDSDHSRLVAAFGKVNVTRETVYSPDAEEFDASVVFPRDPARRVEVVWWDEKARKRLAMIRVRGPGWSGPQEVRVGMTLDAAEAANGGPFALHGFGWDFGGVVTDWKGGAFARLPGGCNLLLAFKDTASEAAPEEVMGEKVFTSDMPAIKAVKPRVWEIQFRYAR
jgi:hypothetical protein